VAQAEPGPKPLVQISCRTGRVSERARP
jgi:hypothetical protein